MVGEEKDACGTPRRLCIITGLPGSGKSTVARGLIKGLGESWEILHADDFIGPTFSLYRDLKTAQFRPWPLIRSHHTRFAGESAAYHMNDHRNNVVLEGHLKNRWEIEAVEAGLRDVLGGLRRDARFSVDVLYLERDRKWILEKMVCNPHRFPDLLPADPSNRERVETLRRWIYEEATMDLSGVAHRTVAAQGDDWLELTDQVASELKVDWAMPSSH